MAIDDAYRYNVNVGSHRPGELAPRPSLILASVLCFTVVCVVDFIAGGRSLQLDVLMAVAGLGVGAGLLAGLGWVLLVRFGGTVPTAAIAGLGGFVAAAGGLWLVVALNAIAKLGGPHQNLAFAVLGFAAVVALAGAVALLVFVQIRRGEHRKRTTVLFFVAALASCVGLVAIDRTVFPGNYPAFHMFLEGLAIVAGTLALGVLPVAPPLRWSVVTVLLALAAVPLLVLLPARTEAISAIVDRPFSRLALTVLRRATDPDRDGYSSVLAGQDCSPFNAGINPGASEVPGNGIDENCQFGDALAHEVTPADNVPVPKAASPTSVVLITIDALRPDRMSLFANPRPTTPNLSAWAREGARVYTHATTSGGFTTITLPSIMRGIYPRRIGWDPIVQTNRLRLFPPDKPIELLPGERRLFVYGKARPSEAFRPLAWWLRRRGMQTAAVVDDGRSGFLAPRWGLAEGFETYVDIPFDAGRKDQDQLVARLAIEQIQRLDAAGTPFFLWVHFYGPHWPDTPRPEFGFPDTVDGRYDAEIAFVDRQVGQLLAALDKLSGPVATIVTSDHGEVLTRQGRFHGRSLGEDALRVPLLLKGPGISPGRVDLPVSLVDILPTVLALTETPVPPGLDGVDLVGTPPEAQAQRLPLAETWYWDGHGRLRLDKLAVFSPRYRLESDRLNNALTLYRRNSPTPESKPDEAAMKILSARLYQHFESAGGIVQLAAKETP